MEALTLEEHALAEGMTLQRSTNPTFLTLLAILALFALLTVFTVFGIFGRVADIFRQLTTEAKEDWGDRQL